MYGVIAFMAWSMLGLCSLFFLAEFVDMVASARRRRLAAGAGAPTAGAFNLKPRESTISSRHFHGSKTGSGMGGLNQFD